MTPPDGWSARGQADTAPTPKPDTTPVYAPPTFYQPSLRPLPPQPMPPYVPPRSRPTWVPILVLVLVMIFGAGIFGVKSLINHFGKNKEVVESQTYPLSKSAAVTITTLNGSINVQSWDQPQADVRIIKRGNSDDDIQNIPVTIKNDNGNLSIDSSQARNNTEVRFEIKLPRDLGQVRFNSTNGAIKVSDIAGSIAVETTNGSITLSDVSGVEKATTTNGAIKAVIENVTLNKPMEFTSTNGSIDIRFDTDFNAVLEASTVHGSISLDDDFNIPVQKSRPFGQRAGGRIGSGGPPLNVSTTNGSIRISK